MYRTRNDRKKTNEITAIPEVIKRLNLENVICTWDALNTQKENVKAVRAKGGDYCIALKANQPNFYKDVADYFDEDRLMIIESGYEGGYQLTREKNHEAVITYEYYQTEKVKWYAEKELWEGLKSIGLVKKTIEKSDGTKVEEKRYYISSLLLNINLFSYAIRTHWNVENKLHWQMDFTLYYVILILQLSHNLMKSTDKDIKEIFSCLYPESFLCILFLLPFWLNFYITNIR